METEHNQLGIQLIRKKEARLKFCVSVAVFDRWQYPKSKYYRSDFPKKIHLGKNVYYVLSEIEAYLQKLLEERE